MRRFSWDDLEYDIRVTLDMPEEIFKQLKEDLVKSTSLLDFKGKELQQKLRDHAKKLAVYSLNKSK